MTNEGRGRTSGSLKRNGLSLLSFALVMFPIMGFLFRSVYKLEKVASEFSKIRLTSSMRQDGSNLIGSTVPFSEKTCEFPIVYNKPYKTASTKIRSDITAWAKREKRNIFRCSSYLAQATFQMRECISTDRSGCGVVATHIVLSPVMREILKEKIGKYKLVTSTRDPERRIVSLFLQLNNIKARDVKNSTAINQFLRRFNPWTLYNYHTGDNRVGTCPMKEGEHRLLDDMVNRADVVIDLDLFNVSQAILEHEKLFPLTDSVANVRSSTALVLEERTKRLLRRVSCVEERIHRMYRIRMASAYEKVTKKPCLSYSREAKDCFDEMYRKN